MVEPPPHVPPPPFVPPNVPPLSSSFPALSSSKPRSEISAHQNSVQPPLSSDPTPPPPPPPPPPPLAAANPAQPSSGISPEPRPVLSPNLPSDPSDPNHLLHNHTSPVFAPSSSPAAPSLAVSTSLTTPQPPSTAPSAAFSVPNPATSGAPLTSPLLPTPSLQAHSALHIPQAPPSSNPLSHSFLTSTKPNSAPNPQNLPTPASSSHHPAPKHHQPSYAQVARGPRGPGFVRSHASDIESFARLPRTGINIISGSREGLPSFSFVNADLPKVEGLYSRALVMKFHGGRPSLESSHKEILSWGIEQPFSIGPLSSRSFLLRFQDEKDLLKVLSRPSTTLITFPYRVFRWHSLCHLKEDSCLAPVWISLPRLPLQCFIPEFLESVANKIGRFLCLDKATATLARPSAARLCVEIDLRKPPPQFIWIGLFDGVKQQVIYERLPKYCNGCNIQGHTSMECSKGSLDTPLFHAVGQYPASKGSTQHVRQNAPPKKSAANHLGHIPKPSPTNHPSSTNPSPPLEVEPLQYQTSSHIAAANQQLPHMSAITSHEIVGNSSSDLIQDHPPPPPQQITSATLTHEHLSNSAAEPDQIPPSHDTCEASLIPKPSENGNPDPKGTTAASPSKHQSNPAATHLKPSNQSVRRQSKTQKHKSVVIALQQSNVEANQVHWEAVSRQVAVLEQARLSAPTAGINSTATPNPPTENLPCQAMPAATNTSLQENESESSGDRDPHSPLSSFQEGQDPYDAFNSTRSLSEGEEPREPLPFQGHNTEDSISLRHHSHKRNKRHPDQPLKIQLRARKDPNPPPP